MNATDQRIYNEALAYGAPDLVAEFMVDQARDESANYSSGVYLDDNNAFGMHFVGQYGATASTRHFDGTIPYAHYNSLEDSVDDLVTWLNNRESEGLFYVEELTTPQAYADALKSGGYYGESAEEYGGDLTAIDQQIFVDGNNSDGTDTGGSGAGGGSNTNYLYIAGGLVLVFLLVGTKN